MEARCRTGDKNTAESGARMLMQPAVPLNVSVGALASRILTEVEDLVRGLQTVEHNLCGILYSGIASRSPISQKRKNRLTLKREVLLGIIWILGSDSVRRVFPRREILGGGI